MRLPNIVRVMSLDDEYRKPRNVPQLVGAVCIEGNTGLLRDADRAGNVWFWCGRGSSLQQVLVPGNSFKSQSLGFRRIWHAPRRFRLVRSPSGAQLRDRFAAR